MKKFTIITFILFLSTFIGSFYGQSSKEQNTIEKCEDDYFDKMKDYDTGVVIADSLFEAYKSEPFDILSGDRSSLVVGSAFVRNCYAKLHNLDLSETYCLNKVIELEEIIKAEIKAETDVMYQKIVDKADELYNANNYAKAVELYERALILKPDDSDVQNKLNEAKSKLD